jgi:hypothetical protein
LENIPFLNFLGWGFQEARVEKGFAALTYKSLNLPIKADRKLPLEIQ